VLLSDLNEAPGNLILCESQYAINRDENFEEIILVHHPLNWFMDQQQASRYFNTRARVVITGHEHLPDLTVSTRGSWQQLHVAAGAMNPPAQTQLNPYTYNWLEFSWLNDNGRAILEVVVSPRVWNPTETRFDPDYHRTDGKGFRKLSLDCGSREVSETLHGTAADAKTAADEVADMPENKSSTVSGSRSSVLRVTSLSVLASSQRESAVGNSCRAQVAYGTASRASAICL
jgi:hypothetical protein